MLSNINFYAGASLTSLPGHGPTPLPTNHRAPHGINASCLGGGRRHVQSLATFQAARCVSTVLSVIKPSHTLVHSVIALLQTHFILVTSLVLIRISEVILSSNTSPRGRFIMDTPETKPEQASESEGIPKDSVSGGNGIPVSSDLLSFQTTSNSLSSLSDMEDPYSDGDGIRYQDVRVNKRKRKSAGNSQKTPGTDSNPNVFDPKVPKPKPLLKSQLLKVSRIFLWNSGGKKMQILKDTTAPKTMMIDDVTIYIQRLSSDEAKSLGVKSWDVVLAKIEGFKAEIAEHKITNFWASWKHNFQMARKAQNSKGSVPNPTLDPTAEAGGLSKTSAIDTPNVDENKRKCTDTPNSYEPLKTRSYVETVTEGGSGVASNVSKSKKNGCNLIKVDGLLEGKSEFSFWPDMRGQPAYDKDHARGKIVCYNLTTLNFWCTYIPIAAQQVGDIPCKAWTFEEYEVPKILYTCLIPKDTCNWLAVRKLINATLVMNKIGMEGVLSCRTSYMKNSNQRICHIEVTDQIANLLNNAGLVLKGPVCSLTFRLKSGADEEPDVDLIPPESMIQPIPIPDDVEMLESGSAGGSMLCGTPDGRVLDCSADTQPTQIPYQQCV